MNDVYISSSYDRKSEALELALFLSMNKQYNIVSRWLTNSEGYSNEIDKPIRMRESALHDLEDVSKADILVGLIGDNLSNGGCHTELGIALALDKRIVLIGERTNVFHWHRNVEVFCDIKSFKKCLKELGTRSLNYEICTNDND